MIDSNVRKIVARVGIAAKLTILFTYPHCTGLKLANDGWDIKSIQHYVEHKNIQYTVRYTEVSPIKFREF